MLQIKELSERTEQCSFCNSKKTIIMLYSDNKPHNQYYLCDKCFNHLHNVFTEYDKLALIEKIIALKELGCSRNVINDIVLGKDILNLLKTNDSEDDNENL